jgi:integration host factor subunit beta
MENLSKREIVTTIYERTAYPQKQVTETVQRMLDCLEEAFAEGRTAELRNFGVFSVEVRRARIGRNPLKPSDLYKIPERAAVKFRAGKILKDKIAAKGASAFKRREQA